MFDFFMGILVKLRMCEVVQITYCPSTGIVSDKCYRKRRKNKSKSKVYMEYFN